MLRVQILGADIHISYDEQVGKCLKEVHGWPPRKIKCQFNLTWEIFMQETFWLFKRSLPWIFFFSVLWFTAYLSKCCCYALLWFCFKIPFSGLSWRVPISKTHFLIPQVWSVFLISKDACDVHFDILKLILVRCIIFIKLSTPLCIIDLSLFHTWLFVQSINVTGHGFRFSYRLKYQ